MNSANSTSPGWITLSRFVATTTPATQALLRALRPVLRLRPAGRLASDVAQERSSSPDWPGLSAQDRAVFAKHASTQECALLQSHMARYGKLD